MGSEAEYPPSEESRIGSYQLLELRGRGATADVWIAREMLQGELVALKIARKEHLPQVEVVFRQEERFVSQLKPEHILNIKKSGVHEGRPYLVMPLLRETLRDRLDDVDARRALSDPGAVLKLMLGLTEAVQSAHQCAVLHCDLKPENILFDANNKLLVSDFGLARKIEASGAASGDAWGGARGYMSPEQVEKGPLTAASDVFSLGVIMYELLSGELPFGRGDDFEARQREGAKTGPFPRRLFARRLEWELAAICEKALQLNPEQRYQTAAEMKADLLRAAEERSIGAERSSFYARLVKWVRRATLRAATIALVLTVGACLPFVFQAATRQVGREMRAQLSFMAVAQAGAVLNLLTQRALLVHAFAQSSLAASLTQHAGPSIPAAGLSQFGAGFDSINVFSRAGVHTAREPAIALDPQENCAFKDFFRCAEQLAKRGAPEKGFPACIARLHRSRIDEKVKIGISAPIFSPRGEWIGVAEGSTIVRDSFGPVQMKCGAGECWTALLGPRDRDEEDEPLPVQLTVLAHPSLQEGREVFLPESMLRRVCEKLGCVPAFDGLFALRSRDDLVLIEDYVDPLNPKELMIAAVAPVGRTGLHVLIVAPRSAAENQVQALLRHGPRVAGLPLFIVLALLLFLKWAPRRPWLWRSQRQRRLHEVPSP